MSVRFSAADQQTVRKIIHYRYNSVKSRCQALQARLHDVNAIVKIKNPSLLLQLQKSPVRSSPHQSGFRH